MTERQAGLLAFLGLAISFLFAVYLGAMGVALPELGKVFALGTAAQGKLFPASFGGSVTGVLLCGFLSDRYGRRGVLLLCLALTIVGLTLFAGAQNFALILLAAALTGGGGAAAQTVASALLVDLFPQRRAAFLNAVQVAFGAGAVAAPLAARAILESPLSWRGFYLILAAFELLLLIVLSLLSLLTLLAMQKAGARKAATPPMPPDHAPSLLTLLRQPPLILLCLSAFLYAGAEVALFSWAPTYLRSLPGGQELEGVVVSAFWLAMTLGRTALIRILHRVNPGRLRARLAGCAALFSALLLFTTSPLFILVLVAVTGLCFSGIFSLLLADGGERYPEKAGGVLGLIVATSGVGAALLPWIVGALRGADLPWSAALAVVPLASVGVALLAGSLRSRRMAQ